MNNGQTAIKVIVFIGVLSFVLLAVFAAGLKKTLAPNLSEKVRLREKFSPFDATRAHQDVKTLAELGPRAAGSPSAAAAREFLKKELTAAGMRVWEHAFETPAEEGTPARQLVNLIAICEGTRPDILLFTTAYDARGAAPEHPGANESAAGSAWLLEWARALGPRREGRACWFVWFEGEALPAEGNEFGAHLGSQAFLRRSTAMGDLSKFKAMMDVRMIGDCFLNIAPDPQATPWLRNSLQEVFQRLRYTRHFTSGAPVLPGADKAFREAGVPALLLADPVYGGSPLEHKRLWRTPEDTPGRVCPESLQAVADVLYHALPAIEGRLETPGLAP